MNEVFSVADAYDEAEKQDIEIIPFPMKKRVALVRPDGLLAIDYSKIRSEAEEKAILLEEIGHFCTHAFYPPDAPFNVWERQEAKAARFIFEKYYPPESIAEAMKAGAGEPWEIAERLSLPERFVREMLQYYTEIRCVDFNDLLKEPELDTSEIEQQDIARFEAMVRSAQKEKAPPVKAEPEACKTKIFEDEKQKMLHRERRAAITGAWY